MAESEVEGILREIRERVISQQQGAAETAARSTITLGTNGRSAVPASDRTQQIARPGDNPTVKENLALINSYLTTTARAWDRLPPLVSKRSGLAARLELWLKRHLKRATRWYAWEQVNFNAAVHHALRDMLPVLTAYEQELEKLRARIEAEADARRTEAEHNEIELAGLRVSLRAEVEALSLAINTERLAAETEKMQVATRLAQVVSELREGNQQQRDVQRVSFKQLALESSETAVLEDRARRKTEVLLEELKRRIELLEKGKQ